MAEHDDARGPEHIRREDEVREPGSAAPGDETPEFKPIPPEMYKGPGGCGFTGCM